MSDFGKRVVYQAPGMENATVERNSVYGRDEPEAGPSLETTVLNEQPRRGDDV